jgi:hypothetical protein
MTIDEIMKKAECKREVAESLWYHSIALRDANPEDYVNFQKLFKDKEYRLTLKEKKVEKKKWRK